VLWTTGRDAAVQRGDRWRARRARSAQQRPLDEPCDRLLSRTFLDDAFAGKPVRAEALHGERWLRHHVEPIVDARYGDVSGAVGVSIDITELKRAEQRAWETANRDRLTGLPNRLSLEESLATILNADGGEDGRFAVLFVDLDRFKAINDTLGHDAGDEALKITADRIAEAVRGDDIVGRPGGDEFIVVLRASPAWRTSTSSRSASSEWFGARSRSGDASCS